jgi:hypothetical protein
MALWSRLLSRLQVWSAGLDWRYNVDKLSVCLSVVIQLASYLQWSLEWSFKVQYFQGALVVVSMVLSK